MSTDINIGSDKRPGDQFVIVTFSLIDMGLAPNELALYVVVARFLNHKTHVAFPSLATLGKAVGMSKPTLIKTLKSLEKRNLLKKIVRFEGDSSERAVNHYELYGAPSSNDYAQGGKNSLLPGHEVVNDVDNGGKEPLQQVVKELDSNYIESNKIKEQELANDPAIPSAEGITDPGTNKTEETAAPMAQVGEKPVPKKKPERKRDGHLDALAWCVYGVPIGKPIAKRTAGHCVVIKAELVESFPDGLPSPEHIIAAFEAWDHRPGKPARPKDPARVVSMVREYLKTVSLSKPAVGAPSAATVAEAALYGGVS